MVKTIKIIYMKKLSLILVLVISVVFAPITFSDEYDNRGYVGTPPGFYDDIDPNTLEDEDKEPPRKNFDNPAKDYSWEEGVNNSG